MTSLDHRALYRLPWSLSDNPIAWLEPTEHCNLHCDGCYRTNTPRHKSLEEIDADLDVFERLRTFDGVSIAGGDPLTHPEVVEIVRRIAARGHKPVLNTNGQALTRELLRELARAGLAGFTFHVDSKQRRPHWDGKDEVQLNELRAQLAEQVAEAGGIACAFNATVYPDTLAQMPKVLEWAAARIDIVQTVVFILFRHADLSSGAWDYYAGGEKVRPEELVYAEKEARRIDITARDVVELFRRSEPEFNPCAYLNGTHAPDSFKWLLALRLGDGHDIYGYCGNKMIELVQAGHHATTGRYLAYTTPWAVSFGNLMAFGGALIDGGMRRAALSLGRERLRHPWRLGSTVRAQSVMIIQPIDILADGSQSMCDGCPDMTVENGKLVWSCRLEEPRKYGTFLTTVPRVEAH